MSTANTREGEGEGEGGLTNTTAITTVTITIIETTTRQYEAHTRARARARNPARLLTPLPSTCRAPTKSGVVFHLKGNNLRAVVWQKSKEAGLKRKAVTFRTYGQNKHGNNCG